MKEIPVIGMSPGNSYFKDEVVKDLLKKVIDIYGKAVVLIADIPAIHTYIALGYPENRARRDKAIPQGNNLRNRTKRAMDELGYSTEQIRVVDWAKDVEPDVKYQEKLNAVNELYTSNSAFREATEQTTADVLKYSNLDSSLSQDSTKIAVKYLLAELAFMEFAPTLLNADKVTYIYHKDFAIYDRYRAGEFDGKLRTYLDARVIA